MSYNTRRSPANRGLPNTQTQVNYHQGNIASSIGRGRGTVPNQGYSPNNTQSFTQQPFIPQGYSTVSPAAPAAAPTPPPAQTPAPVLQKTPAVPSPPAQQQQTLPTQPSAPSQATGSDAKDEGMEVQNGSTAKGVQKEGTNGEGAKSSKPHWMKKGPAVKVSRKTRKRRQNARLRRLLIPKNSLIFLNELHSGAKFTCQERLNALSQYVYTVTVEVDGKEFTGQGMSKLAAKSQASENALKVLVLEKMSKTQIDECSESATAGGDDADMDEDVKEDIGDEDLTSEVGGGRRRTLPEDDLPWGSLASFALHKLFAEWQQQGTQVPLAKPAAPVPPPTKTAAQVPMKKIPEDASKRHPVVLLNQLRPGSLYKESQEGSPPNLIFSITVSLDGQDYVGTGTSKREAKKECAKAALASMGIHSEV